MSVRSGIGAFTFEGWRGAKRSLGIKTSDGPFSGPCASRACGHWRLPCPTNGEAYLKIAHPCRNCPTRCHPTSAWGGLVAWAAHHYHRKAGTWEFPEPEPSSPVFQSRERYDRSRRERYSTGGDPSAFRCRLERDSFLRGVREGGHR